VKAALIVLDNLRIGGFQRLALDQAYLLSDLGYEVTLVSLSRMVDNQDLGFVVLEREIFSTKNIQIIDCSGKHLNQIRELSRLVKEHSGFDLVLSHSLRGTVLLFLSRKLSRMPYQILTTIHQLPTLSAPIQRLKRFIYSQFSDRLFGYSDAVIKDWNDRVLNFPTFSKFFFRKKIELLRNGVYIPKLRSDVGFEIKSTPRLIFLGRNIAWKGVTSFEAIALNDQLKHFDVLLMVPNLNGLDLEALKIKFGKRLEVVLGKSIIDFVPRAGDVHLYPTQYGRDAKYLESISLNCLEMACMGIPSLITTNGKGTWPEDELDKVFIEVDWTSVSTCIERIISASTSEMSKESILSVRALLSIENQIKKLVNSQ
jgi:hypothetical protein